MTPRLRLHTPATEVAMVARGVSVAPVVPHTGSIQMDGMIDV